MKGEERRIQIINRLKETGQPVSGGELAQLLHVSRQVIVQDIALLRAQKNDIIATARGYMLYYTDTSKVRRVFALSHTADQIKGELETIIELGGTVLDVIVEHPIYGQITANLMIETTQDIQNFLAQMDHQKSVPLMQLTKGVHLHTIEGKTERLLDLIAEALRKKGYLLTE